LIQEYEVYHENHAPKQKRRRVQLQSDTVPVWNESNCKTKVEDFKIEIGSDDVLFGDEVSENPKSYMSIIFLSLQHKPYQHTKFIS
jgi:hypothetical protein